MILLFGVIISICAYGYLEYRNYKNYKNITKYNNNDFLIFDTNQDKILCRNQKILLDNYIKSNYNLEKSIEQLFYDKISYKEITYNNLYSALSYKIYHREILNLEENNNIIQLINLIENNLSHKFINDYKYQEFLKVTKSNFNYWYQPYFLKLLKISIKFPFHLWMLYHFNTYKNGNYLIYYPDFDKNKKNLVLFHCSVGGAFSLIKFIIKYKDKYNLIIPEIPGVSWNYYYECDRIYNLEYYNDILIKFLEDKIPNQQINLLSHSLGGLSCTKFYYQFTNYETKNMDLIKKIFFVESPFLPFYIFLLHCESYDLTKLFNNYSYSDVLCVPFLHKDLYVQYYINRNINNLNCCYFFNSDIETHVILVEKDNKIPTEYYKYFIETNDLHHKANLKIFKNKIHGAFLISDEMQTYIDNSLSL